MRVGDSTPSPLGPFVGLGVLPPVSVFLFCFLFFTAIPCHSLWKIAQKLMDSLCLQAQTARENHLGVNFPPSAPFPRTALQSIKAQPYCL